MLTKSHSGLFSYMYEESVYLAGLRAWLMLHAWDISSAAEKSLRLGGLEGDMAAKKTGIKAKKGQTSPQIKCISGWEEVVT